LAIEAVIWDFGGVFTTSPFEAFNRFEAEHGLPKDFIRGVNAANPHDNAWARFERAQIDREGFDQLFLEESTARGHAVRGAEILPLLSGDVRPRMVAALRRCKSAFKVGCITNNMAQGHGPGMSASPSGALRAGEIMAEFEVVIESSKAGVRKPDPAIYAMMCEALQVSPPACVYLDDLGINCKPAAQMGMTAIKVASEDQALAELERVTGLRFPPEAAA
jgi:putative hydrolase of the HAD superfamily